MSNKDIIIPNDPSHKMNIHLFSFSLLKSKTKFAISQFNSFNFKFGIKYSLINEQTFNTKMSLVETNNHNTLKNINIDLPSSEKLLEETFQNNFLNEYETSFANFCGLSKSQFKDIYINKQYIPVLNEFGDINIPANNIADLLKTYSHSTKLKITRRVLKKYRINKLFKTYRKSKNMEKFKNEINNFIIEEPKNDIININENNNYLNKEIDINNLSKNNTFHNLKKKLKISIQNNNNNPPLKQENIVNNHNYRNNKKNNYLNNNVINNEKIEGILSNNIPNPPMFNFNRQQNLPTPSNNVFNFNFQNKNNEFLNKKRGNTSGFNNNINNINNNLNTNIS